jgi:hypothetical protein
MVCAKNKNTSLSSKTKEEIRNHLKNNTHWSKLSQKYEVSRANVFRIKNEQVENSYKIRMNNENERKRNKKPKFFILEKMIIEFISECRAKYIPLNGSIIKKNLCLLQKTWCL